MVSPLANREVCVGQTQHVGTWFTQGTDTVPCITRFPDVAPRMIHLFLLHDKDMLGHSTNLKLDLPLSESDGGGLLLKIC